jgi:Cu+-exporting ATPase
MSVAIEKDNKSNIEHHVETHIKSRILVCGIEGMTCTSCSGSVEGLLISMQGVIEAVISLATNTAHVEYVPSSHLNAQIIIDSMEEIGFGAEILEDYEVKKIEKNIRNRKRNVRSLILSIDGMTCSSCQGTIENTLNDLEGVIEATVVLATNTAYIEYVPNDIMTTQFLIDSIEDIGFGAEILDDSCSKISYNNDALVKLIYIHCFHFIIYVLNF